jgi:biopolymer transport protein ExbD
MRWFLRGFLVVIALSIVMVRITHHTSRYGYNAKPVTNECDPRLRGYEDARDLVLHITSDGQVKMNDEAVDIAKLRTRLGEIYKTRAEHILFLDVSDDVAFETVADFLSQATSAAGDVKFIIVTPRARPSCREKWASIIGAA